MDFNKTRKIEIELSKPIKISTRKSNKLFEVIADTLKIDITDIVMTEYEYDENDTEE